MTSLTASSAGGPAPGSVDHANVLSFLGATRTLTKVWVLVAGLVGLLDLLEILFSLLTLRFPAGGLEGLVYAVLWLGTDLLILGRMGAWEGLLERGAYQGLKEPLLLWGLLGTLFGVIPGLLLLWLYLRVLPWADAGGNAPRPRGGAPTVPPPPPYSPAPSSPSAPPPRA
jgi:hypothetical protein